MTDEGKLHEQVARGDEAARLLKNPVLKDALDVAEKSIIEQWKECDIHDESSQRMCKMGLQAQQNLRQWLVNFVTNGQAASHDLTQIRDPRKPKRS